MATEPRYTVRTHALPPEADASDAAHEAYAADLAMARALGEEMNASGPYKGIPFFEGGQDAVTQQFNENLANQILFLAFKDGAPVGMLAGVVAYLFDRDYVLANCMFLYVKPLERDGKAAILLLSAFRQWSEQRGADELRMLVTSADNIEKTHKMLKEDMDMAHLGGNYAFPLTPKGAGVLNPLRKAGAKPTK